MSIKPSALSFEAHKKIPSFDDINIYKDYTSRGTHLINVWNDSTYKYSLCQLNKGTNSISNLEVVTTLNIRNISHYFLEYSIVHSSKYNIKIYLGIALSNGLLWIRDTKTYNTWPERYQQSINASLTTSDNTDKI